MIFDTFAGIVERELPNLFELFNQASIFTFDNIDFTPAKYKELINQLREMFFLPFPVVAVEAENYSCILWDCFPPDSGLPKLIRFFLFISQVVKGYNQLYFGKIFEDKFDTNGIEIKSELLTDYKLRISLSQFHIYKPAEKKLLSGFDVKQASIGKLNTLGELIIGVIEKFLFLNTPNRFIVEVAPVKTRKLNPKRIVRSPDRPQYTLLTVKEIQKRYNLGKTESKGGKSPAPHPRRRHYRTLRSEKFTHKQGQTILIPATWIGRSEVQKGNRIYRIRFDV